MTTLQYRILRTLSPREPDVLSGAAYHGKSKLRTLLGEDFVRRIPGRTVVDFGCGDGLQAIELARFGARKVIGIDIREDALERAKRNAVEAGVAGVCRFASTTDEPADIIVSIDGFEHYEDPAHILAIMDALLRPGGEVLVSFGPTWYHPLGGHLFSIFPWSHLVFSEKALIRWRSDFKSDGATRFREVAGGLNQMSIRRFEQIVHRSPFDLAGLETVPIRKLAPLHGRLTREFTTAIIRARLLKR